jgi:branched-subunit amino acid aminotransferase/4-amino-4-deoxychorismate lyase
MASMETADLKALAMTNYGHFTSMRVERGNVRGLGMHLQRLANDCQALFGADIDIDLVRRLCAQETSGIDSAVVRVTVFDPELDMAHPGGPAKPQVLVTVRPAAGLPAPPLRAQAVTYAREVPVTKHVGLFGTIYRRRQAQLAGYDDVLFLDAEGNVSEGATWNVGFIIGGSVIWPEGNVLPGVTMRLLQNAHPHQTALVPHSDLGGVEAAFATNANVGVRVIGSIGAVTFPQEHPVLTALADAYANVRWEPLDS